MLPMWIAKRDPLLAGQPDPPRCPGVKREPISRCLPAESPLRRALFDVLLEKDRRRQFLKALREMPLDQLWRQVLSRIGR
jgi:hypothetical protein